MRIRKTLAKALGQLRPPASPPSDTWIPSYSLNTFVGGSQGLFCQLNQSPWDVYPNHRYQRSSFKCFEGVKSLPNPKEEAKKISGEISVHGMDVREVPIEERPLLNKRVNAQRKNKNEVDTVNKGSNEIIMCKKNDGRKWFCKRPAKLPHTFCEHHLMLSRSYKGHGPSGSGSGSKAKNQQKETKNIRSEYYYYSTVTPSGGKRRCARNVNDVKEVKIEVLNGKEEVGVLDHEKGSGSNGKDKLKIGAKRGRKPAKYRSLESMPAVKPNNSTAEEANRVELV